MQYRTKHAYALVGIITCVGILISVMMFDLLRKWDNQETRSSFERAAENTTASVDRAITRRLIALHAFQQFFLSSEVVTREEFKCFVTPLLKEIPGTYALSWISRGLEEIARSKGLLYDPRVAGCLPEAVP